MSRGPKRFPDLESLAEVVAPGILEAMRTASEQLTKAGIRHALVGGLAVGAYGYPRATKDVDFLVGPEAFVNHEGGIVTIAPGVPILVGKIPIDPISVPVGEEHLHGAIEKPEMRGTVPIAPVEALIYLKLLSPRKKDSVDIVEMLRSGADAKRVREYVKKNGPDLLAKLDGLVEESTGDG